MPENPEQQLISENILQLELPVSQPGTYPSHLISELCTKLLPPWRLDLKILTEKIMAAIPKNSCAHSITTVLSRRTFQ